MMTEMSVFSSSSAAIKSNTNTNTNTNSDFSFGVDSIFAGLSVSPQQQQQLPAPPRADDSALLALSLPSVPSYQPLYNVNVNSNSNSNNINNDLSPSPSAPPLVVEDEDEDYLNQETTQLIHSSVSSSSSAAAPSVYSSSAVASKKGSLKTLYATEVIGESSLAANISAIPATSLYPEVPNITRNGSSRSMPPQSQPPISGETQSQVEQGRSQATLVNELLQENSRLSEEVSRLKSLLDEQRPSQDTSLAMATTTDQREALQPTNNNVKYVCCGGCRQWLVAPKTAVYVVCSRCEAVNNCNIATAPPGTLPSNVSNIQMETNALTQQRDDVPWFLECFKQYL